MSITTRLIHLSASEAITTAAGFLCKGDSIVIPTETVYGLTADATNEDAVRTLYNIKRRAFDKPSAVYLPNTSVIEEYAYIESDYALRIIARFLPGPLTVILRSRIGNWLGVTGASDKIGIRVSSDNFVQDLVRCCDCPLIATSANVSGEEDCRNREELYRRFNNVVALIVYHDDLMKSKPSTVVDLTGSEPVILREGAIAAKLLFDSIIERDDPHV